MIYDEKYRLKVAQEYHKTGNAKAISIEFDVPVRSVYRWGKLYAEAGENTLRKKSRSPITKANQTDKAIEEKVVTTWFCIKSMRTFSAVQRMLAEKGVKISQPTIKAILKRKREID